MPSVSSDGFSALLHQLDGLHELGEALERVVLALERDQDRVRCGERVEGEQAQRRRAVDDDVVVLRHDAAATLRGAGTHAACWFDQLDLCAGEVRRGWDHLEEPELGRMDQLGRWAGSPISAS